jgi:hypothetical protein
LASENEELVTKGEDFSLECDSRPEESAQGSRQGLRARGIIDRKLTYRAKNIDHSDVDEILGSHRELLRLSYLREL